MIRFLEFFLEYRKGNNAIFFNPNPTNGKNRNIDPSKRVHANSSPKKYNHKHPIVDSICAGTANNVQIAGQPLLQILSLYGTEFTPGVTTLGNSSVEVEMYEDEEGLQVGILRNRKSKNGM